MKASLRPAPRSWWRAGLFSLLLGILIIAGTALVARFLAAPAVRAASLPVRNLVDGARAIRVNGFDLWYREIGPAPGGAGLHERAPTLVVIHGGPGMSDHYFGSLLNSLADRYRVIFYDQRGSGYSQIRPEAPLYRFRYLIDELETLRRRAIHSDRMVLLGHSYGGLVAMGYAVEHPKRVAGMILVSSMPPRDYRSRDSSEARFDEALLRESPATADRMLLASYRTRIRSTLFDPARTGVPDLGYMSYVPGRLLWETSIGYDYTKRLKQLHIPVVVLYGARDTFPDGVPHSLAEALEGSKLVRFDSSGHWAFFEEPERFLSVVRGFLDSLPAVDGEATRSVGR